VEAIARASARQIAGSAPDRLVPRPARFVPRQSPARGRKVGPSPVDRGRSGSKHHLLTDGHGGITIKDRVDMLHDVTAGADNSHRRPAKAYAVQPSFEPWNTLK
jgi:hypothetical protein